MATVKLRDEVTGQRTIDVVRKRALVASACDGCGKVFAMLSWCNDTGLGYVRGTFDEHGARVVDANGRGLGNGFSATVCSFGCAHTVFTGGWRNMPDYEPFAKVDATLVRAEVKITALVKSERDLTAEWDRAEEVDPHDSPRFIVGTFGFGSGRPLSVRGERVAEMARSLSDLADGVLVQTRARRPETDIEAQIQEARAAAFREAAAIVARMLDQQ